MKLLRQCEVIERTGLCRSTIWKLRQAGDFPPARRIVGRVVGFAEADVEAWLRARPVEHGEAGGAR